MQIIKILLVEDDEMVSELMCDYLNDHGFSVQPVFSVTDGISYIKNEHFDLLLLDINLPDFSGYELLKNIKATISLPIIVISAHSETKSKILAFKYGASDYMVKPLDLEELEARMWVHLSKHSEIKSEEERALFKIKNTSIFFKGEVLDLTSIEFDILSLLVKHKNQTLMRENLVHSLSTLSTERSLDNHIKNIRKKIGDNGNKAIYLKTEYGVGYRLVY